MTNNRVPKQYFEWTPIAEGRPIKTLMEEIDGIPTARSSKEKSRGKK